MHESLTLLAIDALPGSRHGLEGPTALIRLRWLGPRPEEQALNRLQQRLAHALWCQERLDWKDSHHGDWRGLPAAIPERAFPDDFLLAPAPSRLSGLLAAGLTALQWGAFVPVVAARVLHDQGQEMALAVPYRLPTPLQLSLTLLIQIAAEVMAVSPDPPSAGDAEAAPGWRQRLEQHLAGGLLPAALDVDGFHMAWQARQRGLPLSRLDFGIVEIGHGTSRRRYTGSMLGLDGLATKLASNKVVIKRQLLRAGVPVPEHRLVQTDEEALLEAQELGWPVVLKPIDQSKSHGVTANIWRAVDLLRAYRKARSVSQQPLLLERQVSGHDHRLLVVDGQVVAQVTRRYIKVRGDGFSTLAQLIERARAACSDPAEAALYGQDGETRRLIDAQGLSLEEVVEPGRMVAWRRQVASASQSGFYRDLSDAVHPELAQLAVRSAAALGVRLAGVDVITTDPSLPPLQSGAMVLELNPRPWLRMFRSACPWRPIDRQVFEIGCPPGYRSIPVLLFDGSATGAELLIALEAVLEAKTAPGAAVIGSWSGGEMVQSEGEAAVSRPRVRIAAEPVVWVSSEESREAPGDLVLSDSRVGLALLNLSPAGWLAQGFPCRRCHAGVLSAGETLLEQGLLAEWLAVVRGPVLVVGGSAALHAAVRQQVDERLQVVDDPLAALEWLRALVECEGGGG